MLETRPLPWKIRTSQSGSVFVVDRDGALLVNFGQSTLSRDEQVQHATVFVAAVELIGAATASFCDGEPRVCAGCDCRFCRFTRSAGSVLDRLFRGYRHLHT